MPAGVNIKIPSIVVISREDGRCVFEVWVQGSGSNAMVLADREVLDGRVDAMDKVRRLNRAAPVFVIDRELGLEKHKAREGWA